MLFNPVGSVIYTKQEGAVFIISQQDKIDMNVNRKKVSKGLRLQPAEGDRHPCGPPQVPCSFVSAGTYQ